MSEYLPEDEHANYRDWCSSCVNEGDSECYWCRDDTSSGMPSLYDDGTIMALHEEWINSDD